MIVKGTDILLWSIFPDSIYSFGVILRIAGRRGERYTGYMTDNQDITDSEVVTSSSAGSVTGGGDVVAGGGGSVTTGNGGGGEKPAKITLIPKIIRAPNGKFLPGSGGGITRDNARQMLEARQASTARKIREEIATRTGRGVRPDAAVALAAGDLWEQVVMSKDANPRYRYDTWRGIAQAAELLADRRENTRQDGVTVQIGADLARELVDKLLQARNNDGNE